MKIVKDRIDDYINEKIKEFEENKGQIEHQSDLYDEGWIPIQDSSYYPSIRDLSGEDNLTLDIVDALENNRIYPLENLMSSDYSSYKISLMKVVGFMPQIIDEILSEYGPQDLMLDRNAYRDDGVLINVKCQWYIRRPSS